MDTKKHSRHPPKWATQAYRLLAAGRYAALWLPEFLALYEQVVHEQGEAKAADWVLQELHHSVTPSVALRAYKVVRFIYLGWKAYRKIARD